MENRPDEQQINRQHDERVFRDGTAIFNGGDLRELINVIYSQYRYSGAQFGRLNNLIEYMSMESNKFIKPELAMQNENLSVYLNNLGDFLKTNFHPGDRTDDGDTIYHLTMGETGFETEAFLTEFQMLSMDIETAYKKYHSAVNKLL